MEWKRLSSLRESLHRDVERVIAHWSDLRERGRREAADLTSEPSSLHRFRRDAMKRARVRVRRMPDEYRQLGWIELEALRRRPDTLLT